MKKFTLFIFMATLLFSKVVTAQSNRGINIGELDSGENLSKVIDDVDNTKGRLIADDFVYLLKLNTKIIDSNKKAANRYALRKGQRVLIKLTGEEGPRKANRYIETIYILGK